MNGYGYSTKPVEALSSEKTTSDDLVRARFFDALQALRDKGIAHRDIMRSLGRTDSALSKLRRGLSKRPDPDTVKRLDGLGINPMWIENGQGPMWVQHPPGAHTQRKEELAESEAKERWPVSLDGKEQLLVALYRAAHPARREDILYMAQEAARLAGPARTAHSTTPAPDPPARAAAQRE